MSRSVQTRRESPGLGRCSRAAGRVRGVDRSRIASGRRSADGVSSSRPAGSSRPCGDQGRGRAGAIRRAAAISDAVYEALAKETIVGRAEADVAWWIERTSASTGRRRSLSGRSSRRARTAPDRTRARATSHRRGDARHRRHGLRRRRLPLRLHADVRDRRAPTQLDRGLRARQQAQLDGLAAVRAGASGVEVDARRGRRSPRRALPTRTATVSATASGSRSTRLRRCGRSRPPCSGRQRRHR